MQFFCFQPEIPFLGKLGKTKKQNKTKQKKQQKNKKTELSVYTEIWYLD